MADTLTTTNTLKISMGFVDGDTRTITLKNPSTTMVSGDIEALETWMLSNQPVIGDKWGGTFAKIASATKVNTTVLDIGL